MSPYITIFSRKKGNSKNKFTEKYLLIGILRIFKNKLK